MGKQQAAPVPPKQSGTAPQPESGMNSIPGIARAGEGWAFVRAVVEGSRVRSVEVLEASPAREVVERAWEEACHLTTCMGPAGRAAFAGRPANGTTSDAVCLGAVRVADALPDKAKRRDWLLVSFVVTAGRLEALAEHGRADTALAAFDDLMRIGAMVPIDPESPDSVLLEDRRRPPRQLMARAEGA